MGRAKRVYVAHPLRDNPIANVASATEICQAYYRQGAILPVSPLHAFSFLEPGADNYRAMQYCFALLASCDELWVHGKWWTSEGCQAEICFAGCRGIPIRFKNERGFSE